MGVWWYPELQLLGGPISWGMQGCAGIRDSCICISKDLGKQKNHMDSCGWARAEENQIVGQNVLLVPWVTQIPLLFWEGFRFRVSFFPWLLAFSSELALFFFRLQNLLPTPGFLPCPYICTRTLSPNVFLNDQLEVGLHHDCDCRSGYYYQWDSLDSVVGAPQHRCKPTLDTAASCNGGPLEE